MIKNRLFQQTQLNKRMLALKGQVECVPDRHSDIEYDYKSCVTCFCASVQTDCLSPFKQYELDRPHILALAAETGFLLFKEQIP